MVQQGGDDRLQHRLLYPSTHAPDVVHHSVKKEYIKVRTIKIGSILIWDNLKFKDILKANFLDKQGIL